MYLLFSVPPPLKIDKTHFKECLIELLSEMFGQECVNPLIRGDKLSLEVDSKAIQIDLSTLVSSTPIRCCQLFCLHNGN